MFLDDTFKINVVIVTDDTHDKEKLTSEVNEFASPYKKEVNIEVLWLVLDLIPTETNAKMKLPQNAIMY